MNTYEVTVGFIAGEKTKPTIIKADSFSVDSLGGVHFVIDSREIAFFTRTVSVIRLISLVA